jgi:hypothetical protein
MQIKTASDLKFYHEEKNPGSHFFTRSTMRFFGDRMSNYGVRTHENFFELYRRHAVNGGLRSSAYFDRETLRRVYPEGL